MLAMPKDKPNQIESLQWQVLKYDTYHISSIGITLANGSSSPMFTGRRKEDLSDIKEIKITQLIKTIVGTRYTGAPSLLQNLSFLDNKDQ